MTWQLPVLVASAPNGKLLSLTVGGAWLSLEDGRWRPSRLPPSRIMGFSSLPVVPGAGVIIVRQGREIAIAGVDGHGDLLWRLDASRYGHIHRACVASDGWLAVWARAKYWVSPDGEILEDEGLPSPDDPVVVGPGRSVALLAKLAGRPAGWIRHWFWDGAWALFRDDRRFWALDLQSGHEIVLAKGFRLATILPNGTWIVVERDGTIRTGWREQVDPRPGPEGISVDQILGGNLMPGGGWAFWVGTLEKDFLLLWPPDGGPVQAIEVPAHRAWGRVGEEDDPVRLLWGVKPPAQPRVWLIPAAGTDRPVSVPGFVYNLTRVGPFIVACIDERLHIVAPDGRSTREVHGLPPVRWPDLIPGRTGVLVIGRVGSPGERGAAAWMLSLVGEPAVVPVVPHRPGQEIRGAALRNGQIAMLVMNPEDDTRLITLSPDGVVEEDRKFPPDFSTPHPGSGDPGGLNGAAGDPISGPSLV